MIPPVPLISREIASMKRAILRAIRLVFTHVPGLTTLNIVLVIIQGFLPLAALYVMKLIVDTVTAGITSANKTPVITHLLFLLVGAAVIALLIAICQAVTRYTTRVQSLVLTDIITDQIHAHSVKMDLAYYENPAYNDSLHRAQQEGPYRPSMIVNDLVQAGQNSIAVMAIGGFILLFSPLVGIVLVGAAIPAALVRIGYSRRLYELHLQQTESERKNWYYHEMMTDTDHAREIREFGLGGLFRQRFRNLQDSLRTAKLAISRSQAIWEILTQGFITVAVFGSYAVIALMAVTGSLSLGDLVMFFMGFQLCIGYVQSIFSSMNALYEDQLFMRNLFSFLDLQPHIQAPDDPVPVPSPMEKEIRFGDVTFTYPGADSPALLKVNLTLHKGEIIALVGDNGAGKSTFIKLLCRLYDPVSGKITVDGLDLRKMDPEAWRKHTTVLFQDYIRYHFSAQENIWLGDISQPLESPRVSEAARQAAADAVIQNLRASYSSLLGKRFSGGQELSTGEWQKIALARAFFRNAEIVILDEPASSLDALVESEIFSRFRELVQGRTAVIISHRFSTVLLADHIYVFDHGEIIEHGTHAALVARNGHYAAMFRAQADPYRL